MHNTNCGDIGSVVTNLKYEIDMMMAKLSSERETLLKDIDSIKTSITTLQADNQLMNKDVEDQKQEKTCRQCSKNAIDTLILPCTHFALCFKCTSSGTNTCPHCSKPITGTFKVHPA